MITISCPNFVLDKLKTSYSQLQKQAQLKLNFEAHEHPEISISLPHNGLEPSVLLISPIPLNLNTKVDCFLGLQRHLLNDSLQNLISGKRNQYLNEIKKNISSCELSCRDASKIIINLNSLKKSEFPFGLNNFPNGLFNEELCQIARYAGISNNANQIDLIHFSNQGEFSTDQAQIVAELMWYILEGIANRTPEDLNDLNSVQELIIESDQLSKSIYLKRSRKSGRYWIKDLHGEKYYACSEEEFIALKSDQIPDRIFKLLL